MVAKKAINKLRARAEELGYKGPTDFEKRSGCPISFETIRLGIYEGKPVSIPSLILLMKYLEFAPQEIREYLLALGEKEFSELLGEGGSVVPEWQKLLIGLADALRKEAPEKYNHVVDNLVLALESTGAQVDEKVKTRLRARG